MNYTMKQGCFGFLLGEDLTIMNFKKSIIFNVDVKQILDYQFYLEDNTTMIGIAINAQLGQNDAALQFNIELITSIEYLTMSQSIPVGFAAKSDMVDKHTMSILRKVPQFHENPLHFKDIWGAIKKAGGWLWKNRDEIAKGVQTGAKLIESVI